MIIAEASLQHNGKWTDANRCAWAANEAGADAIKFQLFVPGAPLFCPLEGDEKRWPKWMNSVMSQEDWRSVKDNCDRIGIDFMCSVFQHSAVELYKSLKPKWWKVASRAAENFPYEKIPDKSHVIISCGGRYPALIPLRQRADITPYFLQCRMEYPHKPYAYRSNYPGLGDQGLSDHSGSPWPSINALALTDDGEQHKAQIIEVHVDFGREEKLPEEISLDELKLICEARDAFAAMRAR